METPLLTKEKTEPALPVRTWHRYECLGIFLIVCIMLLYQGPLIPLYETWSPWVNDSDWRLVIVAIPHSLWLMTVSFAMDQTWWVIVHGDVPKWFRRISKIAIILNGVVLLFNITGHLRSTNRWLEWYIGDSTFRMVFAFCMYFITLASLAITLEGFSHMFRKRHPISQYSSGNVPENV